MEEEDDDEDDEERIVDVASLTGTPTNYSRNQGGGKGE